MSQIEKEEVQPARWCSIQPARFSQPTGATTRESRESREKPCKSTTYRSRVLPTFPGNGKFPLLVRRACGLRNTSRTLLSPVSLPEPVPMKCPHCRAASEVLDTRVFQDVMSTRRRKCRNGHRFQTYEVFEDNLAESTAENASAIAKRRVAMDRWRFVLANPTAPAKALAIDLGCSVELVRRIRRRAAAGWTTASSITRARHCAGAHGEAPHPVGT